MAHPFSMTTVLRRTPFRMLRWFLPDVGIRLNFDWDKLRTQDLPLVIAAYDQVPQEQKAAAEATVKDIVSLADQEGIGALKEAAKLHGLTYWDLMFKSYPSAYLHAIWAWTTHREVFEQAKKILRTHRSGYSRKRFGLPRIVPRTDAEALQVLKEQLQTFFTAKQKRGKVCTVEIFQHSEGKYCFFAYPDDQEKPVLQHNGQSQLTAFMVCPVFEVIFTVDSNEGSLEVTAKLDKGIKTELENLFIRTLYGIEPPAIAEPVYSFDKLKYRDCPLVIEPLDCLRVEIGMMSFKWDFHSRLTVFEVEAGDNIYDSLQCYMSRKELTLDKAALKRVRFRFFFQPHPERRAGMITAELGESCCIRCNDALKVKTVHRYLQQWGLEQFIQESSR